MWKTYNSELVSRRIKRTYKSVPTDISNDVIAENTLLYVLHALYDQFTNFYVNVIAEHDHLLVFFSTRI